MSTPTSSWRLWAVRAVLLCLAAGLGYSLRGPAVQPPPPPPPAQRATPAAPKTIYAAHLRRLDDRLRSSGNLTAAPDLQTIVGAPLAGRVETVLVTTGDRVQRRDRLALLKSPQITRAVADYDHAVLRFKLAQRTLDQRRRLLRLGDNGRRPVEEARNELALGLAEQKVTRTALELAEKKLIRTRNLHEHGISTRAELEEKQAAYDQARSRFAQATQQLAVASGHRRREEEVARDGLLIQPRVLEAETELELAREEVEHTRTVLGDLGLEPGEGHEGLWLRSPRSGVVVERKITTGQAVSAEQELFRVLDTSKLWLWIHLYETDQAKVREGMAASVGVAAFPGKKFRGRISYLSPELDMATRTQRARIEIDNRDGILKTGMFAEAEIVLGSPRQSVVVPKAALLREGEQTLVYLENGQPRQVVPGPDVPGQDWREVLSGLKPGERVIAEGAFYIHAERHK